jgi:hypothetical protein
MNIEQMTSCNTGEAVPFESLLAAVSRLDKSRFTALAIPCLRSVDVTSKDCVDSATVEQVLCARRNMLRRVFPVTAIG